MGAPSFNIIILCMKFYLLDSRLGSNGILSSSVESLNPLKSFATSATPTPRYISENTDPARKVTCCPQCSENYEEDLAKLVANEFEKSSSEAKTQEAQRGLPQWLKNAKALGSEIKTTDQLQVLKFLLSNSSANGLSLN